MNENFLNKIEYGKVLEAVSEVAIIAYTDKRGRITYANENFCQISGYTMVELYNQDHKILNSSFHGKEFFKEMYATLRSGNIWRGEVRNKRKDGTYYWVDTQIIPVLNENKEVESYASIRFDITERKLMEQTMFELEKLGENLELAKSVAHEINNPLTIINLCCQSLNRELNELNPSFQTRKKIFKILEQSKRIAMIIKDLKYFSRKKESSNFEDAA